jgi:hypothetical protein
MKNCFVVFILILGFAGCKKDGGNGAAARFINKIWSGEYQALPNYPEPYVLVFKDDSTATYINYLAEFPSKYKITEDGKKITVDIGGGTHIFSATIQDTSLTDFENITTSAYSFKSGKLNNSTEQALTNSVWDGYLTYNDQPVTFTIKFTSESSCEIDFEGSYKPVTSLVRKDGTLLFTSQFYGLNCSFFGVLEKGVIRGKQIYGMWEAHKK